MPFATHPAVVGIVPDEPDLVLLTALDWARATGATAVHFAYVDPSRHLVQELPGGDVRHTSVNPDEPDDRWRAVDEQVRSRIAAVLDGTGVDWRFHYLAGRPDRALTHLARAVNASVIIVGTRAPGPATRWHELLEGSVALHLSHHQHRPVLTVPLDVVDWKATKTSWD